MLNSPLTFSVWFHKEGHNPIRPGQERSNALAVVAGTSPLAGWRRTEWPLLCGLPPCASVWACMWEKDRGCPRVGGWQRWGQRPQLASVASGAVSRKGSISDMGGVLPFYVPVTTHTQTHTATQTHTHLVAPALPDSWSSTSLSLSVHHCFGVYACWLSVLFCFLLDSCEGAGFTDCAESLFDSFKADHAFVVVYFNLNLNHIVLFFYTLNAEYVMSGCGGFGWCEECAG